MTLDPCAPRLLAFHKQKTSARTRFLCHGDSVLAFNPVPEGSRVASSPGKLRPHPAAALQALAAHLGLPTEHLRVETLYSCALDTPDGELAVLLVEFTTQDPPFAAATAVGARFIALTEARGLPPIELELLRRAYELLIG